MSERIKDLKDQATFYANKEFAATGSHELWTDLFSEKLAELIVNECRMTVSENFHECNTAVKLDTIIKDHFGL